MSDSHSVRRSPIRLAVLIKCRRDDVTKSNRSDCEIADSKHKLCSLVSTPSQRTGAATAEAAGLATAIVTKKEVGQSSHLLDKRSSITIREVKADLVCLAGFLELLPIPEDFAHRVINIHPVFDPAFWGKGYYGHHVHSAGAGHGRESLRAAHRGFAGQ